MPWAAFLHGNGPGERTPAFLLGMEMTPTAPAGSLPKHPQLGMPKPASTRATHVQEGSGIPPGESPGQDTTGTPLLPADKHLQGLLRVGRHDPGRHAENHGVREDRRARGVLPEPEEGLGPPARGGLSGAVLGGADPPYLVGQLQQAGTEGHEAAEAPVGEGQALHVEDALVAVPARPHSVRQLGAPQDVLELLQLLSTCRMQTPHTPNPPSVSLKPQTNPFVLLQNPRISPHLDQLHPTMGSWRSSARIWG